MKWGRIVVGASSLACLIGSGAALAQDLDLELTMTLIPDGVVLPEAVTRDIVLPGSAALQGVENSENGLPTANENRAAAAARREEALMRAQENRQGGLDVAAEARERGVDLGAELGEAARENRESFVRSDAGVDLPIPDDRPALPERPDLPERPVTPASSN